MSVLSLPSIQQWHACNQWQKHLTQQLKPFGVTHVQVILLQAVQELSEQNKTITQIALAEHAGTDIMMTSKVCRTLERKGYLLRAKHRHDTRARSLAITKAGKQILAETTPILVAADQAS